MVSFFVGLIVFMLLTALVWWLSGPDLLNLPEKFRKVILVVIIVVFVLWCLAGFGFVGGPVPWGWR
jgi:hypothetical protein